MSPAFCLSRRMRNSQWYERFLAGWRAGLLRILLWLKGSENPGFQPKAADLEYNRAI
jgi:hypothetical protein